MADLYYDEKYPFTKWLIISIISYCILLANLIILDVTAGNSKRSNLKLLQIFLIVFEGLIIVLFVAWKLYINSFSQKKKFFFAVYYLLSMMNVFNIYLQPLIMTEALKKLAGTVITTSVMLNITYFIMVVFIFFIENNFIIYFVNLTLSIVLTTTFSISLDWAKNPYQPLINYVGGLFFICFVYFANKSEKKVFILYNCAVSQLENKKSLIDNLNNGFVTINEQRCDYNSKVKEYININSNFDLTPVQIIDSKKQNGLTISVSDIEKNKNFEFNLKNLLFNSFKEFNSALNKNVLEVFKKFEKLFDAYAAKEREKQYDLIVLDLLNLMREDEAYQNYFFVGNIHIKKSDKSNLNSDNMEDTKNLLGYHATLRVYLRYNIISASLEFYLYDISPIIEIENLKASDKYRKLFLNKFSHELKNPLLNIMHLVNSIKKRMKEDNINNLRKDRIIFVQNERISVSEKSENILSQINPNSDIDCFQEISHVKNLTMYLISLTEDFDFISNSELENTKKTLIKKGTSIDTGSEKNQEGLATISSITVSRFRFEKMIKQCVKIFQTKIELAEKNIEMTYAIDENVPLEISSDSRRLKQVLTNILSNALKFTFRGKISISVELHPLNKNLINFEIIDTGIGFRSDVLRMFNDGKTKMLFGNINTKSNVYGCGLGLDLIGQIISRLGENFKIFSKKEEGSTLTFSINDYSDENKFIRPGFQKLTNLTRVYREELSLNENEPESKISSKILEYNDKMQRLPKANEFTFKNLKEVIPLKLNSDDDDIIDNLSGNFSNLYERSKTPMPTGSKEFSMMHRNYKKSVDENVEYNTININDKKKFTGSDLLNSNSNSNSNDISIKFKGRNTRERKTLKYDKHIKINLEDKLEIDSKKEIDLECTSLIIQNIENTKPIIDCLDCKNPNTMSKASSLNNLSNINYEEDKKNCLNNILEIGRDKALNQSADKEKSHCSSFDKIMTIRVLVVDDEKLIRSSESIQIKKYFRRNKNYKVEITECSDGAECLYHIYKGIQEGLKYDYIFSDESMNFMRGTLLIKVLKALKEENMMYGLKIFMVTSYEPWVIINTHGNVCDGIGILTKPLSIANLGKIFESLL